MSKKCIHYGGLNWCGDFLCEGCPMDILELPDETRIKPIPESLELRDEEQFNLGFKTAYKCGTPELLAYEEGISDGCKAQLVKIQPLLESLQNLNKNLIDDNKPLNQQLDAQKGEIYTLDLTNQSLMNIIVKQNNEIKELKETFDNLLEGMGLNDASHWRKSDWQVYQDARKISGGEINGRK